ncbi:unnamed protein product [Ilex paraguariensis]|uniref:BHLH domain-containing protein n=1 Tax=Ilex paraguariensis TaxID=185542 RepID=A0ABC8SVD7_9AQUA
MFPLQQSDELFFQIPSTDHGQQPKIRQDLILSHHASLEVESNNLNTYNVEGRKKKISDLKSNGDESTNDGKRKRLIMHREIERQRRQGMTGLYASLRSLLPLEYIKGKRSTADHVHETVNYIEHLQRKNKELCIKRDKLKKMSNTSDLGPKNRSSNCSFPVLLTVSLCRFGVEILISCGFKEEGFLLSRVLGVLVEEGYNVVSCISNKADEKFFYTIQSEVSDPAGIDLSALKQKLIALIHNE